MRRMKTGKGVKNGSRGEHEAGMTERLAHGGGISSAAEAFFRSGEHTLVAALGEIRRDGASSARGKRWRLA